MLTEEIRKDYRSAYDTIGNYCGSTEHVIREELMRIVDATLKLARV
jgi:hypothetical protein